MANLEKVEFALRCKAEGGSFGKTKMPSIKSISELLNHYGIEHVFEKSYNTVEYRSKGNVYVNSRHRGKEGYKLEVDRKVYMDSSDSYYSFNTWQYAGELVQLIDSKKIIPCQK
mgnify:CR=1 FL=1